MKQPPHFGKNRSPRNPGLKVRPCYYLLILTHVVRNPSPSPAPATQDPRLMGPRRLIANVKDLRRLVLLAQHVLICRQADSFVTLLADGRLQSPHPRARWGSRPKAASSAPTRRHPSFQPKHSAGLGTKLGAAVKTKKPDPNARTLVLQVWPRQPSTLSTEPFATPPPIPSARPLPSPKGLRRAGVQQSPAGAKYA
jgi:hypothetical protein